MFNVRVKRFYDTEQIQIFTRGIHSKGEVKREKKFVYSTGEILQNRTYEFLWNPFTDDVDYLVCDPDPDESARVSFSRTKKKIYDIVRSNCWEWFLTFTFDGEKIDRYSYTECTKVFSKWLNNARRDCPDMVYLVVPEQHKDNAYHFHGLFSRVDGMNLEFSGHYDKQGREVYNVGKYNWGFTTATKVSDTHKASSYLTKYVTKDLCAMTKGKKKYWASRNVRVPEVQELLIEESSDERMRRFLQGSTYIKKVESPYTDVIYIERPLDGA